MSALPHTIEEAIDLLSRMSKAGLQTFDGTDLSVFIDDITKGEQ